MDRSAQNEAKHELAEEERRRGQEMRQLEQHRQQTMVQRALRMAQEQARQDAAGAAPAPKPAAPAQPQPQNGAANQTTK